MMSVSRCFSIIGDSNIKRHMNPTNCRDRPLMSACQIIPSGKMSMMSECLRSVRPESNVCIIACVTNFLTGSEDTGGSVGFRVEPVLMEFASIVAESCQTNPDRAFIVLPPMYRRSPLWYRDGLSEILLKFSGVMKSRAENLHLMSSFPTPELLDDGVHLTPYSGLEFVLYVFDQAGALLDNLESGPSEARSVEASRVLEDLMVALGQDHHRLSIGVESKTCEDSEMFDYQENIRMESWIVVAGLRRLPEGLSPRDWQVQAKADVSGTLKVLMSRDVPIVVVKNGTGKGKDAITTYNVELKKLEDSKEVRDKFGSFFIGGGNLCPPDLKGISIRNRVTPATHTRYNILKVLAERYRKSNPGSKVKVIGFESRPLIKLIPPEGASDSRVMTYDFIQAIKNLPTNFTPEERDFIVNRVSTKCYGKMRALFQVISDDMLKRKSRPPAAEGSGSKDGQGTSGSSGKSGKSGNAGGSGSKSRTQKRGATSPASGTSEKQKK